MNDIQGSYNTAAADYHEILKDYLRETPYERAALDLFAELVPAGPVGDLGCGTGRITTYLVSRGLDAFGIDLTPGMIEVARRQYPGLRFEVGSLFDLDLKDNELAGALAWYSLVHTPREDLPAVFAERSAPAATTSTTPTATTWTSTSSATNPPTSPLS